MINYLHYIFFVSSFIMSFIIIKYLINNALKLQLIDHPNDRKIHKNATPIVGGLAIVATFFVIFIISYLLNIQIMHFQNFDYFVLFIGSIIIIVTGFIDDIKGISAFNKFLFQIIAALIIVLGIQDFQHVIWPLSYYFNSNIYNALLSTFYIVSILNAINLIDGLDGLAGGVSIIITSSFIVFSLISGLLISDIYILFILLGSLIAFIIYNKPPAQTFLGDSGSLFIGWIFAVTSLLYTEKTSFSSSILIPIMLLGLPAFDVIFVMLKRFNDKSHYKLKERLKSIFHPDNNHLHHLILLSGTSKRIAIIILYMVTILTNIIAFYLYINSINFVYGIILILILIFLTRYLFLLKIKQNKRI